MGAGNGAICPPGTTSIPALRLYRHYVYIRADGVCLQARMERPAGRMPVPIGVTPEGRKELSGFQPGVRESAQSRRAQSRRELLRTSNPVGSGFAAGRHRRVRTKGALSQAAARLMVFKLVMAAAKTWRRRRARTSCPKSSRASHSETASRSSGRRHRTPPDHAVTRFPPSLAVALDARNATSHLSLTIQDNEALRYLDAMAPAPHGREGPRRERSQNSSASMTSSGRAALRRRQRLHNRRRPRHRRNPRWTSRARCCGLG